MSIHMLSIVPLIVGIILLTVGSALDSLTMIIIGVFILIWGLIIHSNNLKIIRNCRRNPKWGNRGRSLYDRS